MNPFTHATALALSALGSMMMVSSCAGSRMALPPTLSKEARPMPVKKTYSFWIIGLKQLDFGGYKVTDYQTGWQKGSEVALSGGRLGYSADKNAQKYEFRMTGPSGKSWKALCAEAASKQTLSGNVLGGAISTDLERQATLDCQFQQDQGMAPWTLALALQKTGEGMLAKEILAGTLRDSARSLSVQGTHDLEGTSFGTEEMSGFSFKDGAKELGAVQVIGDGMVWMDPAAEKELGDPLALASAALTLQQGLLKKLDDKEKK